MGKMDIGDGQNGNELHLTNGNELHLTLEQHQLILNQTTDIIFEWDIIKDTIHFSGNWEKKFGYAPNYQGLPLLETAESPIHRQDLRILIESMTAIKRGQDFIQAEARVKDAFGRFIWCRFRAINQYDEQQRPYQAVGIISDIDAERKVMDDLRRRAERDALTGLYNRMETERLICRYLEDRPKELCAIFIIDTDNFKQINDSQGHLFGDAVLAELAAGMMRMTRNTDIVGRIGGDEFTIFLKNITSREMAAQKAQSLIDMFHDLFRDDRQLLEISCSIGIAIYPDDGEDFHSLYRNADLALYQAKSQGKNQYVLMNSDDAGHISHHGYSSLGAAIDSDVQTRELSENLVNYVFQILYNTRDIRHSIQLILEIVGKRFDVSRSYIFESSEDGFYANNTFEWCNDGIQPVQSKLQHLSYEALGDYKDRLQESTVVYCRDINSLPPGLVELLKPQGIYSLLHCAIMDNDKFYGLVGFDECTGMRMWTREEIGMLTLVSQLINTFLLKQRAADLDRQMTIHLNTILDSQDAYVYAIEKSSYRLLYLNRKTRELDPTVQTGMTCYHAFFESEKPCANCPLVCKNGEIYNSKYDVWTKARVSPMNWNSTDAYLLSCFDITEYKRMLADKSLDPLLS